MQSILILIKAIVDQKKNGHTIISITRLPKIYLFLRKEKDDAF
jgi:hypothetical protein